MARSILPPELQRSTWPFNIPGYTPAMGRQIQRERARERLKWEQVRRAERRYAAELRKIARNVGHMINGLPGPEAIPELVELLRQYSWIIRPWARAAAARMIAEVTRRDATAWFRVSREIGVGLREMIETTPLGGVVQQLLDDQVEMISSLVSDAGVSVQAAVQDFVAGGRRYDELIDYIRVLGATQTPNRATLIARTETAKCQSAIVEARSRHIGSDQYIWRTVRDSAVRKEHRRLEGTVQSWDDPPEAEANGEKHHPGNFPNCRCFAQPIIPAVIT